MGLFVFRLKVGVVWLFTLAVFAGSGAALAAEGNTVIWRLAHTLTVPGTLYERILTKEVPARIAQASGGLIRVQPIIGLIHTNDAIGALQQGRVEMADLTLAYTASTYPTWAVLNLPGVVNDQRLIAPIAEKVVLPVIAQDMKQQRIRPVLSVAWIGGAYFSNKPIATSRDFAGLSWRTHDEFLSQLITALGGRTIGMPFEELYPSLDRGLVDAYTTTFPAMYAAGLYKVTKYAIAAPNGTSLAILIVSDQALQKLPQDVRVKVMAAFKSIQKEIDGRLYEESLHDIGKLKAAGVKVVTLPNSENRRIDAVSEKVVWKAWLKRTGTKGAKLLKQVEAYKGALKQQAAR